MLLLATLFSKEKTQQGCFTGFLLPLPVAPAFSPTPQGLHLQAGQPFLLRSSGQSSSPPLFLLFGSDGYRVFRSFPTFQGTGKPSTAPAPPQRHPHSSTIMSLWWSRRTLPLSTYSMLSGLVFTGAQQGEGTRWG